MLVTSLLLIILSGCEKEPDSVDISLNENQNYNSEEADGNLSYDNDISGGVNSSSTIETDGESAETATELVTASKGDYSAIFANELKTIVNNGDISIVINGYKFDVDDDTYCTYFESVGPAFCIGDQVQYKIKVQDRSNEEIKQIDVTQKVKELGGTITKGPNTIIDGDLEYIVFEYELKGERGVAINMPGPDPDHAIGVQIVVLNDSVKADEAIRAAMLVAKTARVTTAEDTTEEEIKQIYGNSWVSGTSVKNSTITDGDKTYSFSVPQGYKLTWNSTDETMPLKIFSNGEVSVTVQYKAKEYTDTLYYVEQQWEWTFADVKSDIMMSNDGSIAYGTYQEKDPDIYGLEAGKVIKGVGSVLVTAECETRMVSLDEIIGFFDEESSEDNKETSAIGPKTAIKHDQIYLGKVDDIEIARDIIAEYGRMQRETYSNPEVEKIEQKLQEKYDIAAVNLGEMDIETAKEIEKAVSYMFDTYPIIKGSLNTISLANLNRNESGYVALTQTTDFVIQDEVGNVPKLVRNEILLNAGKWLDRDYMLSMCKENVNSGYWFKGANDPSKVVVHELGHQLLNVLRAKEYNFYDEINGEKIYIPCLLTEENKEQYIDYYWSGTAMNQEFDKKLMNAAYAEWKTMGNKGTEEDFRGSISQYALGTKSDGGISLHETFAEAVADIYCNGEKASDASKAILKQVK